MNAPLTTTVPDTPITLAVRIDSRRAQLLWQNASPAIYFDLADQFEAIDSDDCSELHHADMWADGMLMWCEGALEAITLATYETSNGFKTLLLWDLACGPDWPSGYTVLTSRPYGTWPRPWGSVGHVDGR